MLKILSRTLRRNCWSLFVLVLGVVPRAFAADPPTIETGAGFFERCGGMFTNPNAIPRSQYEACIFLVDGLNQGLLAAKRVSPSFPICVTIFTFEHAPEFLKFLAANKARLKEPTRDLYADAMLAAWSCDAPRPSPSPGTRTFRIEQVPSSK